MSTAGFEYRNKKGETPFETFLRYTDEKEKSAAELAAILQKELRDGSGILDIGTGNGEYLDLALSKVRLPKNLALTLVEPSRDLSRQLEERFQKSLPEERLRIIASDFQSVAVDETFDAILMSHLFYHVPRADWAKQLKKALSLLKPAGTLIVVLREKDDAYDFKMEFKPLLFDKAFKALTIDDVLEALPTSGSLEIAKRSVSSELKIPFEENMSDTISIIEFYLNKQWRDMPETIRKRALSFVKSKHGVFKQLDCIAVIRMYRK